MRTALALAGRLIRAVTILARDGRIPRPLRWLIVLGALPVPGPFDEGVLLAAGSILLVFYRVPMLEAWRQASREPSKPSDRMPPGASPAPR